jgi:hypothetical protein
MFPSTPGAWVQSLGRKNSNQSVRWETFLKSQTTTAMEMMPGIEIASPARKFRRHRFSMLFS